MAKRKAPEIHCLDCPYMRQEAWNETQTALRCFNPANVGRVGRVTELYPTGHESVVNRRPAPHWCVLVGVRKERTKSST